MSTTPETITKDAFLAAFMEQRPDLLFPIEWPAEKVEQAMNEVRPGTAKVQMMTSIPMLCRGAKCPFAVTCPLQQKGIAPLGQSCPIEMAAIQQFFTAYVEELNVDITRMVEVSIVRDLVDQEIQYMRKSKVLAQEHFIQKVIAGVDQDGNVLLRPELHAAVDFEDRLHRRKERLRNALLATRESQVKAGKVKEDTAQALADLVEVARELERSKKPERVEVEIVEYDRSG